MEGPPTGPEVEEARPQLSLQIALALDEMARAVEGPDEAEADSGGKLGARWRRDLRTKIAIWESVGLDVTVVRDAVDSDLDKALVLAQTFDQNLPRLEALRSRLESLEARAPDPAIHDLLGRLRAPLQIDALEKEAEALEARLATKSGRPPAGAHPGAARAGRSPSGGSRPAEAARGQVNGLGARPPHAGMTNGLVNGLRSARRGLTNGVTNGTGITNGLAGGRPREEHRVSRGKLYLILLVGLALLTVPLFSASLDVREQLLDSDGLLTEWSGLAHASADHASNLSVPAGADIVGSGFALGRTSLGGYLRFRGAAFTGNVATSTMDSVLVFLDADRQASTGYRAGGLGAERLLVFHGMDSRVDESAILRYGGPQDGLDWNGWQLLRQGFPFAVRGDVLEFEVPAVDLDLQGRPHLYIETLAADGTGDAVETILSTSGGRLMVTQRSLATAIVSPGLREDFLEIVLAAEGEAVTVNRVAVSVLGTVSTADALGLPPELREGTTAGVEGTLWQGKVAFDLWRSVAAGETVRYVLSGGVATGTDGETVGFEIQTEADVEVEAGPVRLRTAPVGRGLALVSGPGPGGIAVDGRFDDWSPSPLLAGPAPANGAVDLVAVGAEANGTSFYAYAETREALFRGAAVSVGPRIRPPVLPVDSDQDTVPDRDDRFPADFNNDGEPDARDPSDRDADGSVDYPAGPDQYLETTLPPDFPAPYPSVPIRIYIGQVSTPPRTGADTLNVFLDVDGVPSVGYSVGSIYADFLLEVTGKYGRVLTHQLLTFPSTASPGEWSAWTYVRDLSYGMDQRHIELGASLGVPVDPSQASVHFEMRDALGRGDGSDMVPWTLGPLPSTRGVRPLGGPPVAFAPLEEAPFAFRSERAALEAYLRPSRSDQDEVVLRHGSLFLGWRTLGFGGIGGVTEAPSPSAIRTDGARAILGGFQQAWEQYEIGTDRVKHNTWLLAPPAGSSSEFALHGVLRFPAGTRVWAEGRSLSGNFSTSASLFLEYEGYRVRLEAPYAYEARSPERQVPGWYSGEVLGDRLRLAMAVPGEWVRAPGRTFPVVLDPTGIIDTATSGSATHGPHQRNVFHDGANFWAFYYSGSTVVYESSADGLSWVNTKGNAFSTASMTTVSSWFHDTGATKIVYIAGDTASSTSNVHVRRGTISGTTITWGAENTVALSDTAQASKTPFVTRDSSGYIWVGSNTEVPETWYLRATSGDILGCSPQFDRDTSRTAGSGSATEVLDGIYDYWYEPSVARTLAGGTWQASLWVDTASSGSGATMTVVVERINSSCVVQQTIINEAITLTKGTNQLYSTTPVNAGSVTLTAGQRIVLRTAKTSGNSDATLEFDGAPGPGYDSRFVHPSSTPYGYAVSRSILVDNVLAFSTRTNLANTAAANYVQGQVVPLTGGELYALWYADGNLEGKKYSSGWGSLESIDTTSAGSRTVGPSAVADGSGNVHLVYADSSGVVKYRQRTASWGSATTLDTPPGGFSNAYPTISRDTATGDLYALWVSTQTNQLEGQRYSGSWSSFSVETNTNAKSRLNSLYSAGSAANIAWTWTQGSASPWDVKFSVYSTSLNSRTVDTMPVASGAQEQFQRHVFHDGTYFWMFYEEASADTWYTYSADGTTWENAVVSGLTQDQASVWFHDGGGTKVVYVVGDGSGATTTAAVRRGTISGGTITWGSQTTATVSTVAVDTHYAFITRDSSGYLWIASSASPSSGNYDVSVVRSTNPDDVSAWGSITYLMSSTVTTTEVFPEVLPLTGGDLYALWTANGNIEGKRRTGGSWGSLESIGTTSTSGDTKMAVATVDGSNNVHATWPDATGNVIYRQRTGSWQSPTTLDATAGNTEATITRDTSTGDLYVFWIDSTEQIRGKQYTGGSWTAVSGIDTSTIAKSYLTTPFNVTSSSRLVWMWGQGGSVPYEVKVASLGIPEFIDLGVPAAALVALGALLVRRGRRSKR